ncbi:MAG: hypothetical protein ACE5Z5_13585 [Candidatus Bathyarchaeia archaeon]
MLVSKIDLAKYPFTPEAIRYVEGLGLRVEDLANPDYVSILERAEQRIEEAVLSGVVRWRGTPDYEVEVLSFPASMMLVSVAKDSFLKRRYALAEARKVYSLLREEDEEKLAEVASASFGWKIRLAHTTIGRPYDFAIKFVHFLKHAPSFHDERWKLVNRAMVEGEVYLNKDELARLVEEEVRTRIERRIETSPQIELQPPLSERINRIMQLLAGRREAIRAEELPREAVSAAYPPCIKKLYDALLTKQHLSHMGRFTLTSFLLNVGIGPERLVKLYTSTTDFDERLTRYQVEHIAGKRGSRTKYTPPNCATLKTHGLCPGPDELCETIRHSLTYYRRKLWMIRRGKGTKEGG